MNSQTVYWWIAVLAMGAVTFALRAAPLFLPKIWMQSALLKALNFALPLCVMTLLILASLKLDAAFSQPRYLLAEVLSLLLVLASYMRWRNVLVSMVVGVAALNGWLWLLQTH